MRYGTTYSLIISLLSFIFLSIFLTSCRKQQKKGNCLCINIPGFSTGELSENWGNIRTLSWVEVPWRLVCPQDGWRGGAGGSTWRRTATNDGDRCLGRHSGGGGNPGEGGGGIALSHLRQGCGSGQAGGGWRIAPCRGDNDCRRRPVVWAGSRPAGLECRRDGWVLLAARAAGDSAKAKIG